MRLEERENVDKRKPVLDRPKVIGDIRGVSYIYSLLWRLRVTSVRLRGRV